MSGVGTSAVELGEVGSESDSGGNGEAEEFVENWVLMRPLIMEETDLKLAIKDLTDGKGVDVVYDPIGGDYSEAAIRGHGLEWAIFSDRFCKWPDPKNPLNLALLKGCSLVGVFWEDFAVRSQLNTLKISKSFGLFSQKVKSNL